MKISNEPVVNFKNRNIYKKSKIDINKLKTIKANLTVPFANTTIVHINADFNRELTDVKHKMQRKNGKQIN